MTKKQQLKPGQAYFHKGVAKGEPAWAVAASKSMFMTGCDGLTAFFHTDEAAQKAWAESQQRKDA